MLHKFLFNFIFLFSTLLALGQTDTGDPLNTKLIKVHNKIYMLQGNGGNIGLSFGNDGVFMVDSQFAEFIDQIQLDIKKHSDQPVRILVNTHFHGDHTGGNAGMAKSGAVIFSHQNVRTRLQEKIQKGTKKISEEILPIVTFSEDITFNFNGEKINVFHLPNAHTDGDAMVYFTNSNVLHTGDLLFNGKYPFIDTANGGTLNGYVDGLKKALAMIDQNTKIIPGHGDMGTSKDLQTAIDLLTVTYKKVAMLYANKKTEEEVSKMTDITAAYDEKGYGSGFINTEAFLKMVYGQVKADRKEIENNAEKNKKAREKVSQMIKEQEIKKN